MNLDFPPPQAARQGPRRDPLDELVERYHYRSIQALERGVLRLIDAIRARRRRPEEDAS
jgi:hypothetical protein